MFVTVYDSLTNGVKQFYHIVPNEPPIDRSMHLYHRIPVQVGLDVLENTLGYAKFTYRFAQFFRAGDGCITTYVDREDNFVTICIRFHYD